MLEVSLPSIWASMNSWFTPTILFVLLNLMIGTIAITSWIGSQKNHQKQQNQDEKHQPQIVRTSSFLQRLKSINLYSYRSEELNPFPVVVTNLKSQETETVQMLEQPEVETLDRIFKNIDHFEVHHVNRTKSETKPSSGEMLEKLPQKMKKSASSNSAFQHFKGEKIIDRHRPSTVKEGKSKTSDLQKFGDDDEVDAKADDFINKFKQQLKLQRLESIKRYKEMLNRGAT